MSDIKLTDDQAKRLLQAIYKQPADDDLDIYDPGVVLEYHDAPEDEPDDISPALEHHTAAMLNILALKGADLNLLETTGYQMRQLWKMVLRTIGHA